jgi:two-component system chemotaxis sensor kinase CheA
VVIKGLGAGAPRVKGVSGGAIMGDGRVALILDIASVAQLATEIGAAPTLAAEAA